MVNLTKTSSFFTFCLPGGTFPSPPVRGHFFQFFPSSPCPLDLLQDLFDNAEFGYGTYNVQDLRAVSASKVGHNGSPTLSVSCPVSMLCRAVSSPSSDLILPCCLPLARLPSTLPSRMVFSKEVHPN
jgi:hypothetical protein